MAVGNTTTGSLADSLPTMIHSARIVREYEGRMPNLVDKQTLGKGMGLTWHEISLAQLTSQAVTETTVLDNPQQFSDTDFPLTPSVIGIHTLVTDRTKLRIDKKVAAKMGQLGQNANERKKDEDGLTTLDGFTSLGGAGTTLTSGHISAAMAAIQSNTTEPGNPPYRVVLQGFQIKDIQDEIVAGVGTYPIESGMTARIFSQGFRGMLFGAQVYEDGNITIDSSDDAKGGAFAKDGIVMVQGRSPWARTRPEPHIGGGATSIFMYDEYVYGRRASGVWGRELYSDATEPTS